VSRPALGPTQPPVKWVQRDYPVIKRQGREADHSTSITDTTAISENKIKTMDFLPFKVVRKSFESFTILREIGSRIIQNLLLIPKVCIIPIWRLINIIFAPAVYESIV
jgi:hypothetical protein